MAADTAELLSKLEIVNAHVLGHSMGASIAQSMAVQYPDCIRKAVLVNPFPSIDVVTCYGFRVTYKLLSEGLP